ARQFKSLQPNSLRNGTGNFCSHNREFFRDNREFNRASSESAELLSGRRISTALDVNSALLRHGKIGGLPAFGGRAGAADITGDPRELAGERRRRSYTPLLLSPAIGQRAGELCEGEIGRRGGVEQCRHDPG